MKDHQIYGFQTDHEISRVLHMVYQSILLLYWISESGSHELSKRISSVASNSDSKLLFSKFSFGIKHILKIYEYSNLKKEKKSIILHDL